MVRWYQVAARYWGLELRIEKVLKVYGMVTSWYHDTGTLSCRNAMAVLLRGFTNRSLQEEFEFVQPWGLDLMHWEIWTQLDL